MKNAVLPAHVSTAGNLDTSKAQAMTIDADGMVIVMGMLSNLYSNGNEAVVREYACNARDSHVEAGTTRPIEVRLPSPLNPQFQVEDWGLGLSRDELFNVYARYGASTKRDSNDQIGAFGIGAKSAFTVGTQFTVTAVKDGEKTIVMFAKRRDGTPTVQELFNGPTTEPNGVLVDVGVENVDAVRRAAEKIFACWKPGTVLVDGEQPKSIWTGTEKLADEVYVDWESDVARYDSGSHFKLIMGGVPYAIPKALWNELSPKAQAFYSNANNTRITYILEVPIGRVDITPNREELHITPRTRSTVGRLVELAANSFDAWITAKLDSAENIWEAVKVYRKITSQLNYWSSPTQVYWKGKALGPDQVVLPLVSTYTLDRKGYATGTLSDYRAMVGAGWYAPIKRDHFNDVLFVTNVPDEKVNIVRTYAKVILDEERKQTIVAIDTPGYRQDWFSVGEGADHDEIKYMDFDAYWTRGKAIRKANRKTGGSSNKTKYTTLANGDLRRQMRNVDEIADLDNTTVAFSHGFTFNENSSIHREAMKKHDMIFVSLTGQQSLAVFQRSFPNAVDANQLVKEYAASIINNLSAADVALLNAQALEGSNSNDALKFVTRHEAKITNKVVTDYVKNFNAKTSLTPADRVRLTYLANAYSLARVANPYETGATEDFFSKHLPLVLTTISNEWHAQRVLGTSQAVSRAVIDYINRTPVSRV